MKQYAGIDISLEYSSVCVVDADRFFKLTFDLLSDPAGG